MATKRMKVMPMLMGIVTTVFISFGFGACNANEDNPSAAEQQPQQDYSAFEAYGLTYHNFDGADDVKILNADTTKIAVKKSLADKLGIKTFVNHPIGIWDDPSHLAYGRKAVEELLDGDTYILTVTKVTVAELIGDKVTQLSTDIYVNKNFNASSGLSAKYTDDDGKIHPAVVQMTDPYGYDKGYHLEGDKHSARQLEAIEKGEYEYQTAEDLFANRPNGSWSMRIISMHDKIEFDHNIPLGEDSGDSINIAGEIPIDFELNYFLTFDPEVYWEHWWSLPELIVRKFETGVEGEFGFHPSTTIGFKKQIKLPEDKGKVKLASFNGFSFSFMVGPVPVTVVVEPGIYLQIDASASGAVQFGFAYNYANSFKAGIRYDYGKGWQNISNYEVTENEFDFILPEIDFKAEAGVAIFMAAAAKIYDVAGPELGIGPRLGAEAELTISPDGGIDYRQEVNMRLQAWAGAKIEVLGYNLAEWSTRFDLAGPWTILKYPVE